MDTRSSSFLSENDRVYVSTHLLQGEHQPKIVLAIGDVSVYFPNTESLNIVLAQIQNCLSELSWSRHVVGEYVNMVGVGVEVPMVSTE